MLVASQGRQIGLTAKYEGKAVLSVTGLGVVFEGVDFTYDAEIVNLRQNTIDETYTMKSGKFSQYTNRANETVVTLSKDGHYLDIYFRAYDDGVAYRYASVSYTHLDVYKRQVRRRAVIYSGLRLLQARRSVVLT